MRAAGRRQARLRERVLPPAARPPSERGPRRPPPHPAAPPPPPSAPRSRLTPLGAAPAPGPSRPPPPPPGRGRPRRSGPSSPGTRRRGRGGRAAGPGRRGLAKRHRAPATRPGTASDVHSLRPGAELHSVPASSLLCTRPRVAPQGKFQGHPGLSGLLGRGLSEVPRAAWGDKGRALRVPRLGPEDTRSSPPALSAQRPLGDLLPSRRQAGFDFGHISEIARLFQKGSRTIYRVQASCSDFSSSKWKRTSGGIRGSSARAFPPTVLA